MNEPLDFCRVKKIDEKGFGFLKSLYYSNDIFFHFSQIKREDFLVKLQEMKRGDFFLFYTSRLQKNGKRKADNIWYSIEQVPVEYFPPFIERIIAEFDTGRTNIFDLIFVFNELRKLNQISNENLFLILNSKRIIYLPTTILPYLTIDEVSEFKKILKIEDLKNVDTKPVWYDEIASAGNAE